MTIKPIKLSFAPIIVQQPQKLKRPCLMNLFTCMIFAQLELTLKTKNIWHVVKFELPHILHVRNFQWIFGLSKVIETFFVNYFYLVRTKVREFCSILKFRSWSVSHLSNFGLGFSRLVRKRPILSHLLLDKLLKVWNYSLNFIEHVLSSQYCFSLWKSKCSWHFWSLL